MAKDPKLKKAGVSGNLIMQDIMHKMQVQISLVLGIGVTKLNGN